jgi:hypothetical protein
MRNSGAVVGGHCHKETQAIATQHAEDSINVTNQDVPHALSRTKRETHEQLQINAAWHPVPCWYISAQSELQAWMFLLSCTSWIRVSTADTSGWRRCSRSNCMTCTTQAAAHGGGGVARERVG